jgi:hypothetical protein
MGKNKLGESSLSVLYVTFTDGNQRAFHSRDWNSDNQEKLNPQLGIKRLKNLADKYKRQGALASALLKEKSTGKALQAW